MKRCSFIEQLIKTTQFKEFFMSPIKNKVLLTLILVVMLAASACGAKTPTAEPTVQPQPTAVATEAPVVQPTAEPTVEPTKGPIVITDVIGRVVTLEKPANKLVGTHNPTLNAAIVLGGGGKYLAGFGNKAMSRGLYELVVEGYNDLPEIGKGSNVNMESVVATGADLVILPKRHQDLVPQFEAVNIPTLVILDNVENFDTVKQTLKILGQALGENERAEKISTFIDSQVENAATLLKDTTNKPSVLFLGSSSKLSVATHSMIQSSLIEDAGGTNAVSGVDVVGKFADVSIEQIIAWNPEVIWVPNYAEYTIESLLTDPAWSSISAIQNKRVYQFPSLLEPWDYPTAAVVLGLDWALNNLHPDLYSRETLLDNVNDFYMMVYGKTITPEQLGIE